jgi:hypothetical protein
LEIEVKVRTSVQSILLPTPPTPYPYNFASKFLNPLWNLGAIIVVKCDKEF